MSHRRINSAFLCLVVAAGLLATGGCGSSPTMNSETVPEALTLQLHMATKENKYTYFELNRDGELSYGGGRQAMLRGANPVTELSQAQRQAIWDIIRKHNLADVESDLFPKHENVKWELTFRTSSFASGRTIRCGDVQVPGIKELHDLLFDIQAKHRYTNPLGIN